MFLKKFFFFLLMENLGAMAYSRYTGFREITDRDVLELHCNIDRMGINNRSLISRNTFICFSTTKFFVLEYWYNKVVTQQQHY